MHISLNHLSHRFELKRYDVVTTLNTVNEKMRAALVIFNEFCFIFPTHSKKESSSCLTTQLTRGLK